MLSFSGSPWVGSWSGSVGRGRGMVGQSVTVQSVGVSVIRCQFLTVLEIGAVVIVSVMTGHSAEIRLPSNT